MTGCQPIRDRLNSTRQIIKQIRVCYGQLIDSFSFLSNFVAYHVSDRSLETCKQNNVFDLCNTPSKVSSSWTIFCDTKWFAKKIWFPKANTRKKQRSFAISSGIALYINSTLSSFTLTLEKQIQLQINIE